jgi:GNAT superfamily N-acetyltransferase
MLVREREPEDLTMVAAFLSERHSARVARARELIQPLDHPALLAFDGERLAGVLTYVVDGEVCEVLTLHAARQWTGAGTALLEAVERVARAAGCERLQLVTTNDNVDALRFYQRRGFVLAELRPGAVDASRRELKPEIPARGEYDIPLRDELVLERPLELEQRRE